jgi:hypothetical protein
MSDATGLTESRGQAVGFYARFDGAEIEMRSLTGLHLIMRVSCKGSPAPANAAGVCFG